MTQKASPELLRTPIVSGRTVINLQMERLHRNLADAERAFIADPTEDSLARINSARDALQSVRGW